MWPYWLMFIVPASIALREHAHQDYSTITSARHRWNVGTFCIALAVAVLIGYRYQVGGDWGAYLRQFEDLQWASLDEVLTTSDPGYALLNWISFNMGWGIYGVNVMCGTIFAIGLLHFCQAMPRPWLALTVAVPYLIIVVGMGYTRQGVALGFAMLGLVALKNKSPLRFVVWGLIGASFHKTAVLLLPIAALAASKNRIWSFVVGVGTTIVGYQFLLQDSFDSMYANYVGSDIQSEGALIRLLMNAVPSIILLLYAKRFRFTPEERSLWRWFALISVGMLSGLFAVSSASTALDRTALYLLPLQLVVFSHLPGVWGNRAGSNSNLVSAAVVLYYALVMLVWLNFARYAGYWLPYRFYPFELL